jgi:hypothetical protein
MGTFTGLPSITVKMYRLVQWPQLVRGVSIWFLSGVQLLFLMVRLYFGGSRVCLVTPCSARPCRCGTSVYRMLKLGSSRGHCSQPKPQSQTARFVSEIQPGSRYGLNLVRWLPGFVCSEGECESWPPAGTPSEVCQS